MGSYKICLFFTRKFRWSEPEPPPDVCEAFGAYAEGGSHMTAEQLRRFLIERQGEAGVTIADAESLVHRLRSQRHSTLVKLGRPLLTLEDFYHLLFSQELNPPIRNEIHHDMTQPLSHYYIYTGHNSYLTGNQLSSDCSDAPIIKALKKGVRVIELDVWPNSNKDGVDVLHGRTLTSPVELIKCLKSIKEHAFSASTFPCVITLEDHLTPDLQAKVAEMVHQTFNELVFYPKTHYPLQFPSPEELKNQIILSTKPPQKYVAAEPRERKEGEHKKGKDLPKEKRGSRRVSEAGTEGNNDDKDGNEQSDLDEEEYDEEDEITRPNTVPEYIHLITIPAEKPKGDLKEALKIDPEKVRRLSLSEQQLENAAETNGTDIVRFTQKNILRVYPKGTRFNSSNYNPFVGWMHGGQMVAFNMQGYGKYLWLMQGFFRANGGCGFVKKPDFLLKTGPNGEAFDPCAPLPVKTTLKVKVYMGDGWRMDFKHTHFDAYSPPDFYTRIGIAGFPADTVMKKTKIMDDTWTPTWDEEFTFPLTVPELALLRVQVGEHDTSEKDDFGGQTCLPVAELRPGIRAVPLHDRKGERYNSVRLLMRFEFC